MVWKSLEEIPYYSKVFEGTSEDEHWDVFGVEDGELSRVVCHSGMLLYEASEDRQGSRFGLLFKEMNDFGISDEVVTPEWASIFLEP